MGRLDARSMGTGRTARVGLIALAAGLAIPVVLAGSAPAKTTITFLCNARAGSSGKDVMAMLVQEYNKRQSSVQVKLITAGDWSQQATVAIIGGVPYDVVAGWEVQLRMFLEGGMALDLSPYFQSSALEDFSARQLNVFKVNGKLMAMPYYMGISALYYNADLFDKAGVPTPDATWNWGDIVEKGKKLTVGAVGAKTKSQYGFSVSPQWDRQFLWVEEAGGKVIDDGRVLGDKCYLDSTEALAGITFQRDLVYKHAVSPVNVSDWEVFWAGKLAMWQSGSWDIGPTLQRGKSFRWNIAKRPKSFIGKSAASCTTDGFFIPKNTKRKKEAVDFLRYLTSAEAQVIMMEQAGLQPARKSVTAKYATDSEAARKGVKMSVFLEQIPYATPAPMFLHQKRVNDVLMVAISNALFKQTADPVKTIVDATKQLNAILKKK